MMPFSLQLLVPLSLELLLVSGNLFLKEKDVLLERGDLPIEGFVALTRIIQLAGSEQVVGLCCGKKPLGIAELLPSLAQAADCGLKRGKRTLANQ